MSYEHFNAVVVGSGFGGSVTTYRLAQAGLDVCLLERGKAYPPNSFARAPHEMRNNFWDPSEGLYGLFNLWSFKGSGALVSSGLGGGSLIYANVLIRKDPKWFVQEEPYKDGYEYWPVQYADLEPHYGEVERMMNVQQYPLNSKPYDQTEKMLALQEAARKQNLNWMPLNLAVSFRQKAVADPTNPDPDGSNPPLVGAPVMEPHENYHGMTRSTCRLCGECSIGCNYGSKNTLDYTYISAALRQTSHPPDIRTLCEVKSFEPRRDSGGHGYLVHYVKHDPDRAAKRPNKKGDRPDPEMRTISCDCLILAAGTFGTPFLLFKNRTTFPHLSRRLGSKFSVNGDLLSFIIKSHEVRNGRRVPRLLNPSFGPVITGGIRVGDELDGLGDKGRGFYIEDGGHPYLLSWMAELSGLPSFTRRLFHFLKIVLKYRWGLRRDADLGAEIADLIGDCVASKSSLPVLSMGRDFANGNLSLHGKYLDCDWNIAKSQPYYDRVIGTVRGLAEALDAKYLDNPAYAWNFHKILTAHPLGGCPMGRSEAEGVVDAAGEVFNYPGLFIADGSVLPGPVGPNPSLTIAALADLFSERVIARCKAAG